MVMLPPDRGWDIKCLFLPRFSDCHWATLKFMKMKKLYWKLDWQGSNTAKETWSDLHFLYVAEVKSHFYSFLQINTFNISRAFIMNWEEKQMFSLVSNSGYISKLFLVKSFVSMTQKEIKLVRKNFVVRKFWPKYKAFFLKILY